MLALYILLALGLLVLLSRAVYLVLRDMEGRKKQRLNGLLLLFLSIVVFLSMVSYLISGSVNKNLFGPLGHYLSKLLFNAFGISSLVIPVLVFLGGVGLLRNTFNRLFFRIGGFITGLFFVLFITLGYFKLPPVWSGELGSKVGNLIVEGIGLSGGIIVSVFLLAIFTFLFIETGFIRIKRREKPVVSTEKPVRKKAVRREKKRVVKKEKKEEKKKKEEVKEEKVIEVTGYKEKFLSLLSEPVKERREEMNVLKEKATLLEEKLRDMGVEGEVINIIVGPVITRFEYRPSSGVKISRIASLSDDLAMALRAEKLRILAPIPGKEVVGIEIPNRNREIVYLKELLLDKSFQTNPSMLYIPIGKDITGTPYFSDIGEMPHLLVAGVTGSGKSVFLNSLITSILYKATPSEVRFIMIDPKRIELSIYNGIPHLLFPAITESEDAVKILKRAEELMEVRYRELSRVGVRDINAYNRKVRDKMPYILIVVDELADLLLQKGREVERVLIRLAQKARAVGIHLVLATQRPSVDVITGLIKANFPSRIAFQVPSRNDAKTIMDTIGAEKLLGKGDMLFMPPKGAAPIRLHGPYISTDETEKIVKLIGGMYLGELLKERFENPEKILTLVLEEDMLGAISSPYLPGSDDRLESFARFLKKEVGIDEESFLDFVHEITFYPPLEEFDLTIPGETPGGDGFEEYDELLPEAARIVVRMRSASASMLQRKLQIGYNRAARIIDQLESLGIVGPSKGSKPRDVLIDREEDLPI